MEDGEGAAVLTMEEAETIAAEARAALEADKAVQEAAIASVERTQAHLREGILHCNTRILEREKRLLARQELTKEHGKGIQAAMDEANEMLTLLAAEERRLECEKSSEVMADRQRLERHQAQAQRTSEQTRQLQEDLMRKREAFVSGRDALQGALVSLQEESFGMHDWFYMPAARLTTGREVQGDEAGLFHEQPPLRAPPAMLKAAGLEPEP